MLIAVAAAFLAAAVQFARADDAAVAPDVGAVLSLQLYSVGVMDYCFDEIEKRPAFKEASAAWKSRNDATMTATATLLLKVAKADEIAAVVIQVRNQIAFDLVAQEDKPAACQRAAESLNDPSSDLAARLPDSVARINAALNSTP